MKTKIYIVLLLGLFSMKSNAQEQFLRFDSIQVIQGEHLAMWQSPSFSLHDTVICPVGGVIKVKNVVLDVECSNISKKFALQYGNDIHNYRCKLNGIAIASIKSADVRLSTAHFYNFESINDIGLMYESDLNFKLEGEYSSWSSSDASDMYFRYRIELHHYSYE